MIYAALYTIGAVFTVGFMREDPDSFLEFVVWMAMWPLFLGREIKERLDK